ncbi:Crp/Fnr family transcriptional regulator [Myroides profundi]|uniref:cAMP-binding domain of CRP or a regulatory subunit of cAMP-dependent protein kinases n=1 Tax=Myroides profundi TaxID=480520 RepID=A0AAJ4W512_MYRPR|nr:Crp/Fnr family transcriptional regulator [Myroides profundi]AJH14351.1 transcriptional regulator, Crp/Fnr family [Myroides profundi]SER16479.1 cAMP-binding domain of CRP or a regulatory subunit of cAMP-dependent protein kinases [Myroides profundi]
MKNFIQHIEKFVGTLSTSERDSVLSYFELIKVKKKETVLKADMLCDKLFFVEVGCLRSYYMKSNGIEQTIDFAIENWWLTDNMAFEQHTNSNFYIQAVEKSEVIVITREQFALLLEKHPIMEKYYRQVFQRAYAAAQYRVKYLYEFSREELYFHFEDRFPEFIQRIPQYLLASYLGFSPEYLSEIKKKRFS